MINHDHQKVKKYLQKKCVYSRVDSPGSDVVCSEGEEAVLSEPIITLSPVTKIALQLSIKVLHEARNEVPWLKYYKDDGKGWMPIRR